MSEPSAVNELSRQLRISGNKGIGTLCKNEFPELQLLSFQPAVRTADDQHFPCQVAKICDSDYLVTSESCTRSARSMIQSTNIDLVDVDGQVIGHVNDRDLASDVHARV